MEYTIGQISKITGLSEHTIRFYEKEKLIPKINRNKNRIRIFSEEDLNWVNIVKCFRDTNMSIDDIKKVVLLYEEGEHTLEERKSLIENHRQKIESQIQELKQYLNRIDDKLDMYEGKIKNRNNNI